MKQGAFSHPNDIYSRDALFAYGYLILSALLLALQGRWFPPSANSARAFSFSTLSARTSFNIVYGLLLGVLTTLIVTTYQYNPENPLYQPIIACLAAILIASVGASAGHWITPGGRGSAPAADRHLPQPPREPRGSPSRRREALRRSHVAHPDRGPDGFRRGTGRLLGGLRKR